MVPSRALGEYDRFDGSISIESVLGIPIGVLWVQLKRMEPGHDEMIVQPENDQTMEKPIGFYD